jgi:hypothetical protein
MRTRFTLIRVALVIAAISAAVGLVFLVYGIAYRPYTVIEAEIAFFARRLQHGYPLYVDPHLGAWEEGAPPSRYYVLYPPLWPFLLAHVSPASAFGIRTVGRVLSILFFTGTLAALVRGARANKDLVLCGALLAMGLHLVAREAGLAQCDIPAVALSTFGLLRANRKGRLDALSASLLVLAPLVKPNMLGGLAGAFLAHIATRRQPAKDFVSPFLAAAVVGGTVVGIYHVWSGGEWLHHIVWATGQAFSVDRWVDEFPSRMLFLGAPHALVLALAIRRRAGLLAVLPLAMSLCWCIATLGKYGSATHYWLEPTMAALVALGAAPASHPSVPASSSGVREPRALGVLALSFAALVLATSLPELARKAAEYRAWPDVVADVRRACALEPGKVALANDARIEMELNGRVVIPAWETAHMIRAGTFPVDAWREDLASDAVGCLVDDAWFAGPQTERSIALEGAAYRRELRDNVDARFGAPETVAWLAVFRPKK